MTIPPTDYWDELRAAGQVEQLSPEALIRAQAAVRAMAQEASVTAARSGSVRRWRSWTAAAAAGLAAGAFVLGALQLAQRDGDNGTVPASRDEGPPASTGNPGGDTPSIPNDVATRSPARTGEVGSGAAASCAFGYGPETLAERAWAFDGTVIAIGEPGGSGYPLQDTRVTFAVNHWYRGGLQSEVIVDMWGPSRYDDEDGEFGASYGIGSRLLVSGEPRWGGEPLNDAVAWSCGFTRYWDDQTGAAWAAVFE